MQKEWNKLKVNFILRSPIKHNTLNDILQEENKLGVYFPDSLRELFLLHNGEYWHSGIKFAWYSLSEIALVRDVFWQKMESNTDEEEDSKLGVMDGNWWIPFATEKHITYFVCCYPKDISQLENVPQFLSKQFGRVAQYNKLHQYLLDEVFNSIVQWIMNISLETAMLRF